MVRRMLCCVWLVGVLAAVAIAKPNGTVLVYSAGWFDSVVPPADYPYDAVTHVARAFLKHGADGSVTVPDHYFDPDLERLAHAHGVKLLMSVGGAAESADAWVAMASHPDALAKFTDTLGRLMSEHHYDGVDIDWEPAPLTDAEGVAYVTLLKTLRAKYPNMTLTTALPPSEYWVSHMDWSAVIASVDYVNVMTYDYSGPWGGVAGHGSNLFPPADYPPQPDYSAAQGMANLLHNHKLPPGKLLMGLITSGYRFRAEKLGDKFPVNKPGYSDNLIYARIEDLMGTGHYLSLWDDGAKMPYLRRDGGADVVSYESPASMRIKCDYAKTLGVAGVMVWHVGSDASGRQMPLMDAVGQSFGVKPATLPPEALVRQIGDVKDAMRGPRDESKPPPPPPLHPATEAEAGRLETDLARLRREWAEADDRQWEARKPAATQPATH